jgi:hypothetical protein
MGRIGEKINAYRVLMGKYEVKHKMDITGLVSVPVECMIGD